MSALSFGQEASVILAFSQLMQVQAVTGAIKAADLASGGVLTPSGIVEKAPPQLPRYSNVNREPVYEPRLHVQRDPVYERRQVIHPAPRYERRPVLILPPAEPAVPVDSCNPLAPSPVEPPWKVLPWMDRYPKPPRVEQRLIKIAIAASDISHGGVRTGLMVDILV